MSVAPSATFSQAVTPGTVSFTRGGLQRQHGGRHGELERRQYGGDVHAHECAGGEHHLYRDGVGGAEQLRHADEQPVLLELHHRRAAVPVQHLAERGAGGRGGRRDTSAVNLGVQFQATSSGFITGVRFYKESDNTGTHIGSLWTSTGTLLASARSPARPRRVAGTGLLHPVAVTAGTTYVASYYTSTGHYALTTNGLASAVTNGPLTALAGGGVYAYGASNAFPSNTFNASNYWVDVVYSPVGGQHAAGGDGGDAGRGGRRATRCRWRRRRRSRSAVVPSTVSFTVKDSGGNNVAGHGELQQRQHGGDVHAGRARWRRAPPTPRRCRGRRMPPARR